jgi:hypothetical protein
MPVNSIIQEDNGNYSSLRIAILAIILADIFNRSYLTITNGEYYPFNWTDAITYFSLFFTKQLQKGKESKPLTCSESVK